MKYTVGDWATGLSFKLTLETDCPLFPSLLFVVRRCGRSGCRPPITCSCGHNHIIPCWPRPLLSLSFSAHYETRPKQQTFYSVQYIVAATRQILNCETFVGTISATCSSTLQGKDIWEEMGIEERETRRGEDRRQ